MTYGQGKLQAGLAEGLPVPCYILVILGPTLSSSWSNVSGGMQGKLVSDTGSSLRSSIISWSYIPNSRRLPIHGLFDAVKWLFDTLSVASQSLPFSTSSTRMVVCSSVSTYHRPRIARIATIPLFHTGHESPELPRIFFFGGIREVSLNFLLQLWWATSQARFRYDAVSNIRGNRLNSVGIAQEFITISKIALDVLHES